MKQTAVVSTSLRHTVKHVHGPFNQSQPLIEGEFELTPVLFKLPAMVLNGKLVVTALNAIDLEDVRFLSSMSPHIVLEYQGLRQTSPEAKGAGKAPQWKHTFGALELQDAKEDAIIKIEVIDDQTVCGCLNMTLGELIALTIKARDLAGGDKLLHLRLASGKDKVKAKGELCLSCLWTEGPAAIKKLTPMMAQMGLGVGAPSSSSSTSPQPLAQPPRPVTIVSQPPSQQHPISGHYQPPPIQNAYGQQVQQPYYAPQPQMMQPQPLGPGMISPPPMQQPMYQGPPPIVGYAPLPPQSAPVPYYPLQPAPQLIQQQPYYAPLPPQPMSAPITPLAPIMAPPSSQQFTPSTSSDDGVFPFSELKITRLIGDGTFGTVSAGEFRSTPVAIKQLKQTVFSQQQWQEFMSEVKFLREARHPNIVLFMGVSFNPYCIVTELLDMSLFDVIHKLKMKLTPKQKVHIALSIARGLASLHGHPVPIIHRDIKSLNVLVSKDLVSVKICDLGMVKFKAAYGQRLESNGTPLWMAPEVLLDQPYDERADVYSYGCVLYELTTGQVPFGGGNISKEELVKRVGIQNERPVLPANLEPYWRDLLIACWQKHPMSRPTMKQIVETITAFKVE